jgi:hypothetical protein
MQQKGLEKSLNALVATLEDHPDAWLIAPKVISASLVFSVFNKAKHTLLLVKKWYVCILLFLL